MQNFQARKQQSPVGGWETAAKHAVHTDHGEPVDGRGVESESEAKGGG